MQGSRINLCYCIKRMEAATMNWFKYFFLIFWQHLKIPRHTFFRTWLQALKPEFGNQVSSRYFWYIITRTADLLVTRDLTFLFVLQNIHHNRIRSFIHSLMSQCTVRKFRMWLKYPLVQKFIRTPIWVIQIHQMGWLDSLLHYSKVPNNRAPPLIIFGKIFRTPPLLLEPPCLLIFDY